MGLPMDKLGEGPGKWMHLNEGERIAREDERRDAEKKFRSNAFFSCMQEGLLYSATANSFRRSARARIVEEDESKN